MLFIVKLAWWNNISFYVLRNHVKSHSRPGEVLPPSSLAPVPLMDGLSGPLSPLPLQTPGTQSTVSLKDTLPSGYVSGAGRGRWVNSAFSVYIITDKCSSTFRWCVWSDVNNLLNHRRSSHRGMRKRKEDEHTTVSAFFPPLLPSSLVFQAWCDVNAVMLQRPVPVMESKAAPPPPPPKFDLEASNFPPLPGSVVSTQGEMTPEMRLSDVVRGLKVTNKVEISSTFSLRSPGGSCD